MHRQGVQGPAEAVRGSGGRHLQHLLRTTSASQSGRPEAGPYPCSQAAVQALGSPRGRAVKPGPPWLCHQRACTRHGPLSLPLDRRLRRRSRLSSAPSS